MRCFLELPYGPLHAGVLAFTAIMGLLILVLIFYCIAKCVGFTNRGHESVPKEFEAFIQETVIPNFHKQRQQGDQFATLILINEADLKDIQNTVFFPHDWCQRPLTDRTHYFSPPDDQCVNYIAARPRPTEVRTIHAEKTLMEKLHSLWNAYLTKFHSCPKHIILYTWMMPCNGCTRDIKRNLSQYHSPSKIVAYTIEWKETHQEHESNRNMLQNAGIAVIQVPYRDRLPSVDQYSCCIM